MKNDLFLAKAYLQNWTVSANLVPKVDFLFLCFEGKYNSGSGVTSQRDGVKLNVSCDWSEEPIYGEVEIFLDVSYRRDEIS